MKTSSVLPAPRATRWQSGYTLVELMVALAIALFLLGGLFTIVQGTRTTYGNQSQLAQLQDSERLAMTLITDVIQDSFIATGYSAADIDWFVPHQANKRIIDASAVKLGIAPEKVVITVDKHGNTSAASIPLALSVAVADGRIKKGDLILLEAMGGGFTWGATLLRW